MVKENNGIPPLIGGKLLQCNDEWASFLLYATSQYPLQPVNILVCRLKKLITFIPLGHPPLKYFSPFNGNLVALLIKFFVTLIFKLVTLATFPSKLYAKSLATLSL